MYCAETFTKFERRSQDLLEFLGAGEEEDFAFAKTLGSPCSKAGILSSAPSATLSREKSIHVESFASLSGLPLSSSWAW